MKYINFKILLLDKIFDKRFIQFTPPDTKGPIRENYPKMTILYT